MSIECFAFLRATVEECKDRAEVGILTVMCTTKRKADKHRVDLYHEGNKKRSVVHVVKEVTIILSLEKAVPGRPSLTQKI